MEDEEYVAKVSAAVLKQLENNQSALKFELTQFSVSSSFEDNVGFLLTTTLVTTRNPSLQFRFAGTVLSTSGAGVDPETQAALYFGNLIEATFFHPKPLPESGVVTL